MKSMRSPLIKKFMRLHHIEHSIESVDNFAEMYDVKHKSNKSDKRHVKLANLDGKMFLVTTFIDGEFVANIPPRITNIEIVEKVLPRPAQTDTKEKQ
jgi:hypothetical protein